MHEGGPHNTSRLSFRAGEGRLHGGARKTGRRVVLVVILGGVFPGWIWGHSSNHLHIVLTLPGRQDSLEVILLTATWKNLLSILLAISVACVSVSHGSLLITVL